MSRRAALAASAFLLLAAACGRSPENDRLARLERELRSGDRDAMTEAGMQLAGLDGGPAVALRVYLDHVGDQFGPGLGAAWSVGLAGPRLEPILDDLFSAIERIGWWRCDGKIIQGLRDSGIDLSARVRVLLAAHDVWKDETAFRLARARGYDVPELVARADATLDGSGRRAPIKSAAIWYLESVAATSADARRVLVRTLRDSGMDTAAEGGLAAAGDAARPEIDALLADETTSEDVRRAALRLVAKLGRANAVESDAVVRALSSGSLALRDDAWGAVVALEPAVAARVVEDVLRDETSLVRSRALEAAGALRLASDALFPLVEPMTRADDEHERAAAMRALVRSGGRGVDVVLALARGGDVAAMRRLHNEGLELAADDLAWIVPALGSSDEETWRAATRLLAVVRGDISSALPELTRLASVRSSELATVLGALGRIGPPAVPVLARVAAEGHDIAAEDAVHALRRLRCDAAERAVVSALASDEKFVRIAALRALTEWKALPGDARGRVVAMLADESSDVRAAAALALAAADFDLLRAQPGAVRALCVALRSPRKDDDADALAAIRALARFGADARDAAAYLRVLQIQRAKDAAVVAECSRAIAAIER